MDYLDFLWDIISKKEVYGPIITIILGYIVYKLLMRIIHNLLMKGKDGFEKKRRLTVFNLMRSIITYIFYVIIGVIILSIFGVNVKAVVASLGIASVVLGLALQDTIKDFIGGVFIITDNFFVVGDTIKYNDFQGEVIRIGFRTTKVKSLEGKVLVLANRNVSEVVNLSQEKANIIVNIPISYETKKKDMEKVIDKIITKIGEIEGVKRSKYIGISKFEDSSVVYTISVSCNTSNRWQIERDINGIIKEEHDLKHIDIPYQKIEIIK